MSIPPRSILDKKEALGVCALFMKNSSMSDFLESPPESETVTTYDRQCFRLYLMLMDADDSGAEWQGTYEQVFGRAIGEERDKALCQYRAHLRRAQWMTTMGYRQMLGPPASN